MNFPILSAVAAQNDAQTSNTCSSREANDERPPRVFYFDAIRTWATFAVIVIHTAAGVLYATSPHSVTWWAANLWDSMSRPAVPLFLMVSGALLLDPRRSEAIATFFRKRALKVLVPFMVWVPLYLVWRVVRHHEPMTLLFALREVLAGPVYVHLWFLYLILALYLLTPILRVWVRNARDIEFRYLLVLWFVCSSILPMLQRGMNTTFAVVNLIAPNLAGYFLLGHYLHSVRTKCINLAACFVLWMATNFFTIVATYFLTRAKGSFAESFYAPLSPNVVLASALFFLMARDFDWEKLRRSRPLIIRGLSQISAASFGIYLIHIIFLELLSSDLNFLLLGQGRQPVFGVLIGATMTLLLSLGVVLVVKKIPFLKAIMP